MASCQEDNVPAPEESVVETAQPVTHEELPAETPTTTSADTVMGTETAPTPPLAKAIQDEEKKAAAKYGNMKKKQSDVMRKRMMGGGKQYFDSGDYALGKFRPGVTAITPVTPEQAAPEKLRNRKTSIPSNNNNKLLSRLS